MYWFQGIKLKLGHGHDEQHRKKNEHALRSNYSMEQREFRKERGEPQDS